MNDTSKGEGLRMAAADSMETRLARFDERLRALSEQVKKADADKQRAIDMATSELNKHLDELNHAHEIAKETLATYVPRETFDAKVGAVEERQRKSELAISNLMGRLWLLLLAAAAVAAGLAAAVVKVITK